MKNHYTYEISKNDGVRMSYIGVRSCEGNPEDDNYWGTSKHLPDNIQDNHTKTILRTFDTRDEAVKHEIYLHNINDVASNPLYYNQAKQTSTKFDTTGTPGYWAGKTRPAFNLGNRHTDKTKAKMSANHYDCSGENNPMFGKPKPDGSGVKAKAYDLYIYNFFGEGKHLLWQSITNITKWCAHNSDYNQGALCATARGEREQHKGIFARRQTDG